jgi:hypothetical protein
VDTSKILIQADQLEERTEALGQLDVHLGEIVIRIGRIVHPWALLVPEEHATDDDLRVALCHLGHHP